MGQRAPAPGFPPPQQVDFSLIESGLDNLIIKAFPLRGAKSVQAISLLPLPPGSIFFFTFEPILFII